MFSSNPYYEKVEQLGKPFVFKTNLPVSWYNFVLFHLPFNLNLSHFSFS